MNENLKDIDPIAFSEITIDKVETDKEDPTKLIISLKLTQPADFISIDFTISNPKCECGSEKVGSPIHSDWCAKFIK